MGADGGAWLDLAYEVGGATDLDEFREIVTNRVGTIVSCDLASYTEVDLDRHSAFALTDRPVPELETVVATLGQFAHQHPLITRAVGHAQTISDYLSHRQFTRLEIYDKVYRHLGAADQLAINITPGSRRVVGIALNRPRRSFDARDRDALDRLRPLLSRAYSDAAVRERARMLVEHLETGTDGHRAVLAWDHDGRIVYASERALTLLRAYLGVSRFDRRLAQMLRDQTRTTVIHGHRGDLELGPVATLAGEPNLLELRERPMQSAAAATAALTARESQLLARAAAGDSNQQIADSLGITRNTVQNHLQSIYRKLDVTSRTAAVAALSAQRHQH